MEEGRGSSGDGPAGGRMRLGRPFWLPLLFMGLLLGGTALCFAVGARRSAPVLKGSTTADVLWGNLIEATLRQSGADVRRVNFLNDRDGSGQRELVIQIGDMVGGDKPAPCNLVTGVHMAVQMSFVKADPEPSEVDWIEVMVYQGDDLAYSVRTRHGDLIRALNGEISDREYVSGWEVSGEAPGFLGAAE